MRGWIELALVWIDEASTGDPQDVRTWPRLDALSLHMVAVSDRADQLQIAEPTANLMARLGILFHGKALYRQAEPSMRRALAIEEQRYGADHPNVATPLTSLASLLQDTNRLTEAEPLMRRALMIVLRGLGNEHPSSETVRTNYKRLLDSMSLPEEEIRQRLDSARAEVGSE